MSVAVAEDVEAERYERLRETAIDRARYADQYVWRPAHYEAMLTHLGVMEGRVRSVAVVPIALRTLPWLARAFETDVPDAYVAVDLNDDGYSAATIACPCGVAHQVEIGTMTDVQSCGRAFFWFGKEVRVGRFVD